MSQVRYFESNQLPEPEEETQQFPAVTLSLVEAIEREFPDKLPQHQVSDWDMGVLVGQQNVVRLLRELSGQRT